MLALLLFAVQDWASAPARALPGGDNLAVHAAFLLAVLIAAWLAAQTLRRPALWLTLSCLTLLITTAWTALWLGVEAWQADAGDRQWLAVHLLMSAGLLLALWRMLTYATGGSSAARRFAAMLVLVLTLGLPWYARLDAWFWYPADAQDEHGEVANPGSPSPGPQVPKRAAPPPRPDLDAEALFAAQPVLVREAVARIPAQTAGLIDLFPIGFAGDGEEKVFRNEVEYFAQLMDARFGAQGRTVSLINSPDTLARVPMATLTNLREALDGVAARMDKREDLLLLFLTSHGSHDHRLYVGLDSLALTQIRPQDLRAALDASGIRWRVIVVSSCYSGGFVDALRDPSTLVITAARADRPSFGCGSDSAITWFGKAFLTQALNQTSDFEDAFVIASRQVRIWELAQGQTPSIPQISEGAQIRKHLAAWRAGVAPAAAVPFQPR